MREKPSTQNGKVKDGVIGYRFGEFFCDFEQGSLVYKESPVRIPRKTFEILTLLVRNAGRIVDKNEIMRTVWPETYVEEANLTVHISNLRKALAADSGTKIETFAKQGYRFVSDIQPVLESAADHATYSPDLGKDETSSSSVTAAVKRPIAGRWMAAVVSSSVIVVLAAIVFASLLDEKQGSSNLEVDSIAVMPIRNETGDESLEFLADGITEDVIRSLSHIPQVVIKSRSTVFRYKLKNLEAREVGKELSADAVLVGKMTNGASGIAVSFELLMTNNGDIVVSDKVERERENSGSIYLAIAHAIEKKLGKSAAEIPERPIKGDAYEFYLRGRYALERRTIPELRNAAQFFQRSIDSDPSLALAYSGLADAYALMSDYGAMSPADSIPKAKAAVIRAIDLEPDLAEAHASLGAIIADNEGDAAAAEREFRRAIELDPNYVAAHQWYAELLINLGRFEEAKTVIDRAIALDPLSRMIRSNEARSLLFSGDIDGAIGRLKRNIDLDPRWGGDHDLLFHAYAAKNMHAEAVEAHLTSVELLGLATPAEIASSREAFRKGGWRGFVEHRLANYEARSKTEYVRPEILAEWNARLGNVDAAFPYLFKAIGSGRVSLGGWIRHLPVFENVRRDPRFKELYLRIYSYKPLKNE